MKAMRTALFAAFALAAGALVVQAESTVPEVKARQELMGMIGKNVKILGEMAGGKTAFDAAAAAAAKADLTAAATNIPVVFEPNVDAPDSEVKPEIWTNWEGFLAKAKVLQDGAAAMDVASLETVQAGMAAVGGSCKGCHEQFRAKK